MYSNIIDQFKSPAIYQSLENKNRVVFISPISWLEITKSKECFIHKNGEKTKHVFENQNLNNIVTNYDSTFVFTKTGDVYNDNGEKLGHFDITLHKESDVCIYVNQKTCFINNEAATECFIQSVNEKGVKRITHSDDPMISELIYNFDRHYLNKAFNFMGEELL